MYLPFFVLGLVRDCQYYTVNLFKVYLKKNKVKLYRDYILLREGLHL